MSMPLAALAALLACTDGGSEPADDTGAGNDTGDIPAATLCDDGLPVREFQATTQDDSLFALAANARIPTTDGEYELFEQWDGCDVLLFIPDEPAQADSSTWGRGIYERDLDELFERAPTNTRFFFGSDENSESAREDALATLQDEIDDALSDMSDDDRAWWESRIHYVEGRYRDVDGWIGETIQSPGWGTMLDREQRIRYIGSFADVSRYDNGVGWFAPNISMAANEAVYANFLAERQHRLDQEDATIVTLWDHELISDTGWAGVRGSTTVTLPDAATMAGFDTLEFDLDMGCNGDGEYGTCPAWDYLVYLYICEEGQTEGCSTEFGRWITTYHREGRYVHDASALLPLLGEGGSRTFEFYTTQEYEITLHLRLSNRGKTERPSQATWLFGGGAFNVDYNSAYEPIDVAIPASATKVELATVISGHGQVSPGTCAEFCPTEHHFYVNGTDNVRELDNAGTETGCMDMVDQGVVPNQYGTWWYGRSGWCPGWEVPVVTIDVTDQVTPGQTASFDYEGFRNGQPYETGGANIVLSSWVVVHE